MDIKGFLKAKAKPLSANTLRNYENSLDLLARTIKGDEPTIDEIIAWLNTFESESTLSRHKSAIYRYWDWRFPGVPLEFPRDTFAPVKEELMKVTTVEIIQSLIDRANGVDDKMFCQTLFILGCRVKELVSDPRCNIPGVYFKDILPTGVRIIAKGHKERIVPVPSVFLQAFTGYAMLKNGLIFPNGYDYYYTLVKRLGEAVGHPELSPHYFRHARTIDLLNKGMSPAYVAQVRGDKNLNMIMRYSALTNTGLQAQVEKFDKESD